MQGLRLYVVLFTLIVTCNALGVFVMLVWPWPTHLIGIPIEQRHLERNWPVPRESVEAAATCLQHLRLEKSLTGGL